MPLQQWRRLPPGPPQWYLQVVLLVLVVLVLLAVLPSQSPVPPPVPLPLSKGGVGGGVLPSLLAWQTYSWWRSP